MDKLDILLSNYNIHKQKDYCVLIKKPFELTFLLDPPTRNSFPQTAKKFDDDIKAIDVYYSYNEGIIITERVYLNIEKNVDATTKRNILAKAILKILLNCDEYHRKGFIKHIGTLLQKKLSANLYETINKTYFEFNRAGDFFSHIDLKIFEYHRVWEKEVTRVGKDNYIYKEEKRVCFFMYRGNYVNDVYLEKHLPKEVTSSVRVDYSFDEFVDVSYKQNLTKLFHSVYNKQEHKAALNIVEEY